mmetsp:Transcript_6196/g.14812  ORF Transcript_6196/g.14812 Transcript_6196/m.14812 type:complete len:399 (+) Transcript_6196:87-1283(+)
MEALLPKEVIATEVREILRQSSVLRSEDFDGRVKQSLHAFYGVGGKQAVRAALQTLLQNTAKISDRGQVKKWRPYVTKLLQCSFDDLTAQKRGERMERQGSESVEPEEEMQENQSLPTEPRTPEHTPKLMPQQTPPLLQQQPRRETTTNGGTIKDELIQGQRSFLEPTKSKRSLLLESGGKPLSLDAHTKVQISQLLDPDLNKEFICRACKLLSAEPALLPCSHVMCRGCLDRMAKSYGEDGTYVECPTCFKHVPADGPMVTSQWIDRWVRGIKVKCAACTDPNAKHSGGKSAAAAVTCQWVGPLSQYHQHLKTCPVVAELIGPLPVPVESPKISKQSGLQRAAVTFKAAGDGQLPVEIGEELLVYSQDDSGWVFGGKKTGECGYFPEWVVAAATATL